MSSGQDPAGQVPPNPIPDHTRYNMASAPPPRKPTIQTTDTIHSSNINLSILQVSYVNRGRHGFVLRAIDKLTGQEVAIKFLERSTVSCINAGDYQPGYAYN